MELGYYYGFIGFDPKTFSDEELFEKQLALTTKRIMAARFGKIDAINQLQMMIEAIEFERRERIFNEHIGSVVLASSSVVIETDVDLQEKEATIEEKKIGKPELRQVRRAIRTTTPKKD